MLLLMGSKHCCGPAAACKTRAGRAQIACDLGTVDWAEDDCPSEESGSAFAPAKGEILLQRHDGVR